MMNVPVAVVSLVEADRQVFPGAAGLDEPWEKPELGDVGKG
ncbi:hypothetical protein [Actinoplanes sp. TFC3]|nr:hypothetical protein [Actinoplanes sp. TFC3]